MKKKSIKDIDKLKEKGWKVNGDTKPITQFKQLDGISKSIEQSTAAGEATSKSMAAAIERSLKTVVETSNKQADKFAKLLDINMIVLKELLKKEKPVPKAWDMSVTRNKQGFIKKIHAKQV